MSESPIFVSSSSLKLQRDKKQERLLRPFRAGRPAGLPSQGVALGWYVAAPSGLKPECLKCPDETNNELRRIFAPKGP